MKALVIFNNLNDIVYLNCSPRFVKHVDRLAETQGLVSSKHSNFLGNGKSRVDPNVIIQLFSPLVTSHRFMREQFGNPYNSVQCEDGTNIVFQDHMGFLFLRIGKDDISYLKRYLGVSISYVTYICGPDVSILKTSTYHSNLLDDLLSTWSYLYSSDQSFLIEAVEQMLVNVQLSSTLIKSLENSTSKIRSYGTDHVHALLFLETKLLSWYSSRRSAPLTSPDLLFLIALCQKSWGGFKPEHERKKSSNARESVSSHSEEFDDESYSSSMSQIESSEEEEEGRGGENETVGTASYKVTTDFELIKHYFILLKSGSNFVPHRVHVILIYPGLYLVFVCEPSISSLTSQVCSSIQLTNEFMESKREVVRDKQYFEALDSATKKVLDSFKKHKNTVLRTDLASKWEKFKIGYTQYIRTKDPISLQLGPIMDIYREAFRAYFNEKENFKGIPESVLNDIRKQVKAETDDFWDFLKVKSSRNITMRVNNPLPMPINKYLEEFPGLVHFIYIDRNEHWVTMPSLDFTREETVKLTKKKIWNMVKFAREHMQEGNFSLMWKDNAFNYAYFLWFEDSAGQAIRSNAASALPWEGYPLPGIISGDFYKQLHTDCFPGQFSPKVKCLELFCIHLGLVTSSCVLEHSKRLSTTICEVTGTAGASDFL